MRAEFKPDIPRRLLSRLHQGLEESPAVVLLGPRQVGKTTLAHQLGKSRPSAYFDLQSAADRQRLGDPELSLPSLQDQLVILDEIHYAPELFPRLRGLIDRARRAGRRQGLYLLLGSASMTLAKQSSESLAGRVHYLELPPLHLGEINKQDDLWLRGGFPDSFTAGSDESSYRWRSNFIQTYLERDIALFQPRAATETMRRLWAMLAALQGSPLNSANLARSLGVDVRTINSYLGLLGDLFLVRQLSPWHANVMKRLSKTPKVFVRDSGLLHCLLAIQSQQQLLSHPVLGASWEGHVIENILSNVPLGTESGYYRTSGGSEVDLVLRLPQGELWVIEIKRSLSPKLDRGFYEACKDLLPDRKWLVYPGEHEYLHEADVRVTPCLGLIKQLSKV